MSQFASYSGYIGGGSGASGVSSLNGETGAVNIVAGTGITVTPAGQNITIDALGGGLVFPIIAPSGSAVAPSYAFSETGNDTGLFSQSDGDISFSNNAALGMSLDNNHNLTVVGTITASNFPFVGSPNTFAGFDGTGALETVSGFNINTQGGMDESLTQSPNNGGFQTQNSFNVNFTPLQNSPNEGWNIQNISASLDTGSSGFSQGTGGAAIQLLNLNLTHHGTGDVGGLFNIVSNSDIGNGTDPITVKGMGTVFGFNNIHANVNLDGSIQGYTFQPNIDAAATGTSNFSMSAFEDFSNVGIPVNGYNVLNSGSNIFAITNNHGYGGVNINPNITTLQGNAGFTGFGSYGNITTMSATGQYSGLQVNPIITTSHGNINGIQITPQVAGGDASFSGLRISPSGAVVFSSAEGISINLNGITSNDPQGVTGINSDSRLSINATTTLKSAQGFQIGNRVESLFHVPSGSPVTGTDSLGNDFAGDLSAEDNIALGPIGLGWASVGFIADMAVASGKTVDAVDVFVPAVALPDPGYPTGGTVTNMTMIRTFAPIVQGGTLNITHLYGYKIDNTIGGLFSAASPDAWGFYNDDNALKSRIYGPLELSSNVSYQPTLTQTFPPFAAHGFYDNSDATNNAGTGFVFASTDTSTDSITTNLGIISGSNLAVGAVNDTGGVLLSSGQVTDATSTARSGAINIQSGNSAGGNSGGFSFATGQVNASNSGSIQIKSGGAFTTGSTGSVEVESGDTNGSGSSGNMILGSGSSDSGASGGVFYQSGSSNSGSSGNAAIQTGGVNSGSGASGTLNMNTGNTDAGNSGLLSLSSGSSNAGSSGNINVITGNSASANTGNLNFKSGDAAVGNSGNLTLSPGSATGTRGQIQFQDGTEGTAGWVWTSTDTVGSGAWIASSGGGANTFLSNLTSPTAINQTLFPDSSGGRDLGDVNTPWGIEYVNGSQNFGNYTHLTAGQNPSITLSGGFTSPSGINGTGVKAIGEDFNEFNLTTSVGSLSNNSPNINIETDNGTVAAATSGNINLKSGTTTTGVTGSINLVSGNTSTGSTGFVTLTSGNVATGGNNSGIVNIISGDVDTGNSGTIFLTTGASAGGFSGDIDITSGTGVSGRGSLNIDVPDITMNNSHFTSNITTPPTTTVSANAGTGATGNVSNATDMAGIVNLTTGSLSLATGAQITVTFNAPYNIAPIIELTPANAVSGLNVTSYYVTSTTNDFTVNFAIAGISALTYKWYYTAIETQ